MMMDDDDDDVGLRIPTQMIAKKKPPRLKSGDRTISVTIENYSPLTPATILIDKTDRLRPSPIPKIKEFDHTKIFYTDESTVAKYDDCPQHLLQHRPVNNFRRSDTLNVREPSAYLLRKTHSFHSNETTVEDLLLESRRGSSVRNSFIFPQEYIIDEPVIVVPPPIVDTNRRSCRMHRSFIDQNKQRTPPLQINNKKDVIKCHSFNEDVFADPSLKRKEPKKFNSANVSLENDIYRSRSNSRNNRKEDETFTDFVNRQNSKKYATKIHTPIQQQQQQQQQPLQQQQQQPQQIQSQPTSFDKNYSFKRGTRHTTSYYLTPDRSNEDIRRSPTTTTSSRSSFNDNTSNNKIHSASLKYRQTKENLSTTKKSKSFITEVHQNFDNSNNNLTPSPYRRDSKLFITDEFNKIQQQQQKQQLQKSPIMFTDINTRSIDHRKSSINDIDYDTIIRSYRQNQIRRKSSIKLSSSINKRKSMKKKSSLTIPDDIIINDGGSINNNNNIDNDNDDNLTINDNDNEIEMKRKRKKIVCIIMSVFLSLVFASVFVVVITLTHSSVAQVSNQTKKVYTFSRDSPIHYNVRQENERLMQESMNRAKFARNFTDSVSLTGEDIP